MLHQYKDTYSVHVVQTQPDCLENTEVLFTGPAAAQFTSSKKIGTSGLPPQETGF